MSCKHFFLGILMLLSISLNAQIKKTYQHKEPNFSVKYPDNWELEIQEGGRVFFKSPLESESDLFSENINIGFQQNQGDTKISDLAKSYKEISDAIGQSFDDYKFISQKTFKLNNENIFELVYEGKLKNNNTDILHFTQWFFIQKGILFTMTSTEIAADAKWHKISLEILNSIELN